MNYKKKHISVYMYISTRQIKCPKICLFSSLSPCIYILSIIWINDLKFWIMLAPFGSVQLTLNQFGSLWISLAAFGSVHLTLDQFGSLWISLAHFGSVQLTLDQFVSLWIVRLILDQLSSLWFSITISFWNSTRLFVNMRVC